MMGMDISWVLLRRLCTPPLCYLRTHMHSMKGVKEKSHLRFTPFIKGMTVLRGIYSCFSSSKVKAETVYIARSPTYWAVSSTGSTTHLSILLRFFYSLSQIRYLYSGTLALLSCTSISPTQTPLLTSSKSCPHPRPSVLLLLTRASSNR
jgi:hypothetical protein